MNMRKIYRKVAKEYGVSVEEVKREMQAAITDAYTNPLNNNEITKAYQSRVPCKGEIQLLIGFIERMKHTDE